MDKEKYLDNKPFALGQKQKEPLFREGIEDLTEHHRKACKAYDDICNGLGKGPYLPVAIFKDLDMYSVPEDKIIKRVTSSGTTGQKVSKINLDADTSAAQQKALCTIAGDFIGPNRIPMLIIDSPDVLRDRKKFSARGAGILGFSMMARGRYYALTPEMELDWESIDEFCEKAAEGPVFAFGFTYMVWIYFCKALRDSGRKLNLSNCYLIHGGGWKKLQDQKVTDEEFKAGLKEAAGIEKVADYYGMAEQTGSIFMQCQEGHLHASIYSDIKIINPQDFSECEKGQWGLIALESLLPESYPGHRLLTEDWGRIMGEDDCRCGRKGRYFEISGRIKKAEIRGCSDTFERPESAGNSSGSDPNGFAVLGGRYPVNVNRAEAYSETVVSFLEELSKLFTKDPAYRKYPEIYALGFWCRRAHIEKFHSRLAEGEKRRGKGLVLHITPSNMPTMFAYSWIVSLLAGNSNIVRLSQRESEISRIILEGINKVLEAEPYKVLRESNAFVSFPRGDKALEEISLTADARIIWGGDETVKQITETPKKEGCIDIPFPDKYSIALMNPADIEEAEDEELKRMAHMFYNDTYGADQNACSSPRSVFWLAGEADDNNLEKIKERWWNAVAEEAKAYNLEPWMATEKYRQICVAYATAKGLKPIKKWDNRLWVVPVELTEGQNLWDAEGNMGIFYEYNIDSLEDLIPYLGEKIQTIVATGNRQQEIYDTIRQAGCPGVDRVVHPGEALEFDIVWDRKDLIECTSSTETTDSKTI